MKSSRVTGVKTYPLVAVLLASLALPSASQAGMTDYCIVPPYVVQNVPPNVMVVVDPSGSMFNFAYFDGFNTTATSDDHDCTSADSCSGFTNPGTYPTYKFYGYFNSDSWYTYGSSKFSFSRLKTAGAKNSTEWDGNWLNWLFMRRVDIVRKVLTGGKKMGGEAAGFDRLDTEVADCDSRGDTKTASNASLYTPFSGSRTFTVNSCERGLRRRGIGGVVGHRQRHHDRRLPDDTFTGSVVVPAPVTGVLQDTVGARARVGLDFLQRERRRKGLGQHRRHEPQQRRQPYQHHPALHEYAAGQRPCGRSPGTSPSRRACSAGRARGTTAATSPSAMPRQDPWNYGTSGTPAVAGLRQELRPVYHRRRAVLRRESAGLPRGLRQRQVGLQLQTGGAAPPSRNPTGAVSRPRPSRPARPVSTPPGSRTSPSTCTPPTCGARRWGQATSPGRRT